MLSLKMNTSIRPKKVKKRKIPRSNASILEELRKPDTADMSVMVRHASQTDLQLKSPEMKVKVLLRDTSIIEVPNPKTEEEVVLHVYSTLGKTAARISEMEAETKELHQRFDEINTQVWKLKREKTVFDLESSIKGIIEKEDQYSSVGEVIADLKNLLKAKSKRKNQYGINILTEQKKLSLKESSFTDPPNFRLNLDLERDAPIIEDEDEQETQRRYANTQQKPKAHLKLQELPIPEDTESSLSSVAGQIESGGVKPMRATSMTCLNRESNFATREEQLKFESKLNSEGITPIARLNFSAKQGKKLTFSKEEIDSPKNVIETPPSQPVKKVFKRKIISKLKEGSVQTIELNPNLQKQEKCEFMETEKQSSPFMESSINSHFEAVEKSKLNLASNPVIQINFGLQKPAFRRLNSVDNVRDGSKTRWPHQTKGGSPLKVIPFEEEDSLLHERSLNPKFTFGDHSTSQNRIPKDQRDEKSPPGIKQPAEREIIPELPVDPNVPGKESVKKQIVRKRILKKKDE